MRPSVLIDQAQFQLIINRLTHQLVENHRSFEDTVIIGLQPRGVDLLNRIKQHLSEQFPDIKLKCGAFDVTFFRDDFRRRERPLEANSTAIDFIIEDKNVILVDDVLYTGRTIRAGLDAMLSYGRPRSVELMVLIDRRFSRELPIEARYVGKSVDSIDSQHVVVEWSETNGKDQVLLYYSK